MTETTRLGFLGTGVMGEPMCRNLAERAGAPISAYDLDPEPLERLRKVGVRTVASVGQLSESADIIFISLPGGPEVEDVCGGAGGLLERGRAGQTVVDCGTTPVKLTRSLSSRFAELGAWWADAPVARTRQAAREGTLSIMVGASEEVFARILPLLRWCATDVTHCGPVGCGQIVKLLNNLVLFQNVVALSEALSVGRRAGIDGETLFDVLARGSADSFALRHHGMGAMLRGNYPEHAFSTVYALKDLAYALQLAEDVGLTLPGATAAEALLEQSRLAGNAERYFPAVAMLIDAQ